MFKTASASIALLALCNPALISSAWAAGCASPEEASALKTAVLQQELMVAALQCHESGAYNRFVNTYRPELQSSDSTLKTFFVRRGGEHGEAGYDTFKTKAANLSALEQARNAGSFCADAHVLFQAALANRGTLMSFVDAHAGAADIGNICVESRPAPILAHAVDKPSAPIKAIAVAATAVPVAAAAAPKPAAQVAVVGVPAHSLPAIPYRHEEAAPPAPQRAALANETRDRDFENREAARNDEEADDAPVYTAEEAPPPPPPPRYYPVRARPYPSYGYGRGYYRDYPAPPPPPYWYRRGYSW
jgi:hypothetical protein